MKSYSNIILIFFVLSCSSTKLQIEDKVNAETLVLNELNFDLSKLSNWKIQKNNDQYYNLKLTESGNIGHWMITLKSEKENNLTNTSEKFYANRKENSISSSNFQLRKYTKSVLNKSAVLISEYEPNIFISNKYYININGYNYFISYKYQYATYDEEITTTDIIKPFNSKIKYFKYLFNFMWLNDQSIHGGLIYNNTEALLKQELELFNDNCSCQVVQDFSKDNEELFEVCEYKDYQIIKVLENTQNNNKYKTRMYFLKNEKLTYASTNEIQRDKRNYEFGFEFFFNDTELSSIIQHNPKRFKRVIAGKGLHILKKFEEDKKKITLIKNR